MVRGGGMLVRGDGVKGEGGRGKAYLYFRSGVAGGLEGGGGWVGGGCCCCCWGGWRVGVGLDGLLEEGGWGVGVGVGGREGERGGCWDVLFEEDERVVDDIVGAMLVGRICLIWLGEGWKVRERVGDACGWGVRDLVWLWI